MPRPPQERRPVARPEQELPLFVQVLLELVRLLVLRREPEQVREREPVRDLQQVPVPEPFQPERVQVRRPVRGLVLVRQQVPVLARFQQEPVRVQRPVRELVRSGRELVPARVARRRRAFQRASGPRPAFLHHRTQPASVTVTVRRQIRRVARGSTSSLRCLLPLRARR